MRKYILPLFLLFLSLCLLGCINQNINVPKSDSIKITKHGTVFDADQSITITDPEVVNYITNNLNSLTLEGMDYIKPNMIIYTLVFYDEINEVKQVNIKSSKYLSFSGDNTPYAIKEGELDLDYLDKLFTPLTDDEIKQLIINAYVKKYDVRDAVDVDKVYMKLTKNDELIIPYLIDHFADDVLGSEKVSDINFYYRDSRRIEVYYNYNSYSLQEAVDNNLLNKGNLIDIAKIQNENCNLGHSWDEGELIQVPGGGKDLMHICLICGVKTTDRVDDEETYSLSFIGAVEYLKEDISGEYGPTSTITIITEKLIDADIEVYANGEKIDVVTKAVPDNGWYYQFGMPSEDVIVEIRVVTIEYTCLSDLDDYKWVDELDKNDIIKVRREISAVGIEPGNLVDIIYSTNSVDINNLYNAIFLAQYVNVEYNDVVVDGGGYLKYDFITNDKVYSITIYNGFISSHHNDNICDVTQLKYYKFLGEHYSFNDPLLECNSFLVYNNNYKVYNASDNSLIGDYEGLDDYEFILYEGGITGVESPYYIETSFGRVYIHNKDIIYLKEGNTFIYYKIVGNKNFSFLFNN